MFVEKGQGVLFRQVQADQIQHAVIPVTPALALLSWQAAALQQLTFAVARQERQVAQLPGITGDHRAAATLERRQGRGDIALGGFVHDHHVEQAGA